ncbi:MAG: hypothetical protein ACXVY5_04515 [Gaiellales bacterium]
MATGDRVCVAIPIMLPPTLPISAAPPRLVERVKGQAAAAGRVLGALGASGRVETFACRSVQDMIAALCVRRPPEQIILAGSASWALKRAIHGLAPVTTVPGRSRRTPPPVPSIRPVLDR